MIVCHEKLSHWLLAAALLFASCSDGTAETISFDSSWQYNQIAQDNEEESNSGFNQRYHLQWAPQITRAMSLDSNMNYSHKWTSSQGTREIISPTLNFLLENDLFQAEFNALLSETKNTNSRDQTNRTYEAVLSSNWKDFFYWPSLSLTYGQNWLNDSEEVHVTDSARQWSEFIIQWELDTFGVYYSYYNQLRDDYVESTSYDEGKHFGRLDYSQYFHDDRGVFSISQQVTKSVTDFSAAISPGGGVDIRVPLTQGLAGVDPIPVQGSLPPNSGLIDGNLNNRAFVIKLNERANIGVKTDLQSVDKLYVYTGEIDPLLADETGGLRWDLYSSANGVDWVKEQSNPATRYNRNDFRYEVATTGIKNLYVKLVVTGWPTTLAVPVTEMEAYRSGSSGDENASSVAENQEYSKYLTDINFRYAPTDSTLATYSLVWDNSEYLPGNNRDRLFQSGGLRWFYNRYFIPSITINNTDTTNSESVDTLQRSYALNIQSTPLPTMESTFSITRNESYEDSELLSDNHTVNLLTSATLYPNLESNLDINLIFNNNHAVDASSEAMGIRWTLTSRLRPSLLADLILEYGANTLDFSEITNGDDSGGRSTLNINYRPSDLISILVNASQGYGEQWEDYQSYLIDGKFSVLRTDKSQVILGYRLNGSNDEIINNFSYNWTWNVSKFFSFQSIANYMITEEENIWAFTARLSARF